MASFTCTSRPPVSSLPGTTVSSFSTTPRSGRQICALFPRSRGLTIPHSLYTSSLSSKKPRVSRLRRGIVCEAQDTALDISLSIFAVPVVTDSTWESLVLKAEGLVLVDFWAPWCGPCKMIDPVVNELAQQYAGKLKFYKLNTDDSPSTPSQYGVRSIPTIMIFNKGEKKDTIIGAVPKTTLTASIEKFL